MSGGRRLGLFGGSFDPVHLGHVRPVRAALEALELERVIYLPTSRPPHKPDRDLAPALARYTMVEMALLAEPRLVVSDHEIVQDRPVYTVDTVEHFAAAEPGAELHLLVGSDSFAELDTWHRWRDLVEAVTLVVMARPGWALEEVRPDLPPPLRRRFEEGRVQVLAEEAVDVSSTEIRRCLARGDSPPAGELPELVLDYIRKYCLYR